MEKNQHVREYAMRVCKEIGWPYEGNLTLLCDCIGSLAYSETTDTWGGFILLMEAVEAAKQKHMRVDRWFFQDGRYTDPMLVATKKAPASAPLCALHPESGKTAWGACGACYSARRGAERLQ